MMQFFEACADWAQRRAVVCVFERDEYDGWYARVQLRDANGPFSAEVNAIEPRPASKSRKDGEIVAKPAETAEEFSARIDKMCADAVAKARKARTERRGAMAYGKAA